MVFFLQALAVGMIKGAVYVIIALSIVIIYKSSQVFNFAVGEFCVMGAIFFFVASKTGLPFIPMILIFLILTMLGGVVIEKIVIQPLMGRDPLSTTLVTIGLSIFLVGLFQITFGSHPEPLELKLPDLTCSFGNLFFTSEQIWTIVFTTASMVGLLLFYQFTRWGIIMRATAEGQVKAMAFGINTSFVLTLTWVAAAVVSALAGLVVAWTGSLQYNMGVVGLLAIPVVLVGGLDSIGGCIVGGLLVGIVEALTTFYLESALGLEGFRAVTPYLCLLLVLMIRPSGLFGQVHIERV
ncbi:MAG: branched-chain amino acid ABC transporter permease [Desulfatiglans sp.]|jgi:branched-chain amino acid transport system permease protein|nr:branched-chain amino acid ABC transporter permease [Thermodesulfobacteriota bacterium]MEE4353156.1 branched-chain amino acid ABC transporter permease [Desulfatiglans sp.]